MSVSFDAEHSSRLLLSKSYRNVAQIVYECPLCFGSLSGFIKLDIFRMNSLPFSCTVCPPWAKGKRTPCNLHIDWISGPRGFSFFWKTKKTSPLLWSRGEKRVPLPLHAMPHFHFYNAEFASFWITFKTTQAKIIKQRNECWINFMSKFLHENRMQQKNYWKSASVSGVIKQD